jgi:S-adenosylmethionine:diacylglycerol 3-amino-3-carboxypropyl transferase
VKINLDKKQVLVDTELPSARIQELIEETGRKAALFGVGVEQGKFEKKCIKFYTSCLVYSHYLMSSETMNTAFTLPCVT